MQPLKNKVAIVAGGTRGAGRGIATELGAAGATVYVTGRSTRTQRSDYDRPETIEETAELVNQAGGKGIAVQVDHLDPEQVRSLLKPPVLLDVPLLIWLAIQRWLVGMVSRFPVVNSPRSMVLPIWMALNKNTRGLLKR